MVREYEQRVRDLQSQLADANTYLRALRDVLSRAPRSDLKEEDSSRGQTAKVEPEFRGQSVAARAFAVLRQHGRPLSISEIARLMGANTPRERRDLGGTLANRARQGKVFRRVAPGTFGLVEWDQSPNGDSHAATHPTGSLGVEQ